LKGLLDRLRSRRSPAADAYRRAEHPSTDTPWRGAPYSVVDLETTGLDPGRDEIISFAAIPIDGGRVAVGRTRTAIVRPRRMPDAETIRIHGLRPDDLAGAPPLAEAIDQLLEAIAGRVIVAHAAWVERGFLAAALKPSGLRVAEPVLDTAVLARHALGEEADGDDAATRLSDVVQRLGLPVHRPHHADGDALTTAQLFIALATRLNAVEPQTIASLARLSRA
jgi:DNA polymerase-3 subunit epsilon